MGAYLSQPKTDKTSTDEQNALLVAGASSMQGWRNSQEDAHNSILTFDEKAAFFAVYDGHGGAEVATYCADKLPQFLKELETYKSGNFEQALKDAFLGFDQTLLQPDVIEIMKVLAGEHRFADRDGAADSDDEDDEDLAELQVEGNLPLSEVLEKYQAHPSIQALLKQKENARSEKSGGLVSARGRRAAAIAAEIANKAVMDPEGKPEGSSTSAAAKVAVESPSSSKSSASKSDNSDEPEEDATVSSSSSSESKLNNGAPQTVAASNNGVISTSAAVDIELLSEQNGSVTSSSPQSHAEQAAAVLKKSQSSTSDSTVSASSDVAEIKQNGTAVDSCSPSEPIVTAPVADITSTSQECVKLLNELDNAAEDSGDDDADFQAENSLLQNNCPVDDASSDENAEENDSDEDGIEQDGAEVEEEECEEADDEEDDDEDDEDEEDDEDGDDEECFYSDGIEGGYDMNEEPGKDSGCTAVVSLLYGRDLYVANAGDSRCVVCRNGVAIDMSFDHKPEDPEETERIRKAGGRVTADGRVNGGLNLSRAIGDHSYKMNSNLPAEEQMISALPDIRKLIISPEDEFMVLACDGIWNYMSSAEVVDFVRERLAKDGTKKLSQICEELFDHCLAPNTVGDGTGCDNMTAVIVKFQPDILKLETHINPEEAEDINQTKQNSSGSLSDSEENQKLLKRPAEDADESDDCVQQPKRQKTGEDNAVTDSDNRAAECDSGSDAAVNADPLSNCDETSHISAAAASSA